MLIRRRFLSVLGATGLATLLPVAPSVAQTVAAVAGRQRELALGFLNTVAAQEVPLAGETVLRLVAEDFRLRHRAAVQIAEFPRDQAYRAIRDELWPWVKQVEAAGVPVVVPPGLIRPEAPPTLPPPDPDRKEPAHVVVIDIVIETLGVGIVDRKIIEKALETTPELRKLFEELAGRVTTKTWSEIAPLLDKIFGVLVGGTFLQAIGKQVGERGLREFLRRLSFKTVLRLVPFVGWAYMGASLMLALKNNWHRFG